MPPQRLLDQCKRAKTFISSKGFPRYCTASTLPDGTTILSGGFSRRGKPRGSPGSKELTRALNGCDDPLFLDFIRRCLDWDPEQRMTPSAALRHAWLRRRLPRPPHEKTESARTPSGPRTPKSNTLVNSNKVRVQLNDERSATLHSQHNNHTGKLPPITQPLSCSLRHVIQVKQFQGVPQILHTPPLQIEPKSNNIRA